MSARGKRARNRRRKKGSRIPVAVTVVIAIVIAVSAVLSLKFVERPLQNPARREAGARLKMPQRPAEQPTVLEHYSAAVLPGPERAKQVKVRHGSVAIIVDDMGSSIHEADLLLAIDVPITFSIIPGLGRGREVAEAAHRKRREVMVHIPMEPKGYRQKPFEKNGLLLAQSDEEIEKRVDAFLVSIPYAVGANNHMGSRFTEDRGKMAAVLSVLKKRGMFFIDSKTTSASVGERVAREKGIHVASRSVFLDNEQNVAAIGMQLHKVAEMAGKRGSAIAICHPHKTTIQALTNTLPALRKEGINFVYASDLVK